MSIRHGGIEPDFGDRPTRARDELEPLDAGDDEGGGMTARWRARVRLQRDQRNGVKDRRERPRLEQTDRRLAG